MARKLFFLLLFIAAYMPSREQAAWMKTSMPPFTLTLTNGNRFSYQNLPKNKPVMLIYFAPDCEHCRVFIKKLTAAMGNFKKTEIIMISYFPLPALQQFYQDFKLEQFPNVKTGTEGNSFLVPRYFKIIKFPFTAFYDKTGKLKTIFREEPSLKVLSDLSK